MTLKMKHARFWVLPVAALAAPLAALADVTVQERTTVNVSILKAHGTSTERIAGDKQRTEAELRCEGMLSLLCRKAERVDIIRLDRDVTWNIEPKKKRYTETSFPTPEQRRAAAERLRAATERLQSCPQAQPAATVDTSKCELSAPEFSVQKTDESALVAGHEARRTNLRLTQRCTSHDPSQACELAYSFDVWLSREGIPALEDRRTFQRRYLTRLGLADSSAATSAQFGQYLAPYAAAIKQLSDKAGDLQGYPLKTTFRLAFSGSPCGAPRATPSDATAGALSGAGKAAAAATSSSAQHAAGWGTSDAVARATGSTVGGYVAGSAAGAFTGNLIGGLFGKKSKPEPAQPAGEGAANGAPTSTTIAEFTTEMMSISTDAIPAAQFEVPAGWRRRDTGATGETEMPSCPGTAPHADKQ
jgi:hypothetical protein